MNSDPRFPERMKVVEMQGAGDPGVLVAGHRPVPAVRPGGLVVQVAAAGVNGPDIMQRRGLYPPPEGASDLLGLEVSGTVVQVGDNVTGWSVGDTLTALTNGGGYAEYVAVDAAHCLPLPPGVSLRDAAGLPETFFTVWSNIFAGGILPEGGTLLVHGGAGGIGSTAIQLAKAFDIRTFATESPERRCAFCRTLGADRVIDYAEEDFVAVLRSDAGGADVILDIVGGSYIARNIKAAAPGATIVQLAFAQGSRVEIDLMPVMLKRLKFTGSTLRSHSDACKAEIAAQLIRHVWPLFADGRLKPRTGTVLPMSEARAAHELMQSAEHLGKILLVPDSLMASGEEA